MHALNITILYLYIYMCTVGFLFPNAELIPKVLGQTWCALVIFFGGRNVDILQRFCFGGSGTLHI